MDPIFKSNPNPQDPPAEPGVNPSPPQPGLGAASPGQQPPNPGSFGAPGPQPPHQPAPPTEPQHTPGPGPLPGGPQSPARPSFNRPAEPVGPSGAHSPSGPPEPYVSNPFFVSTDGLIKILQVNPGSALLSSLYFILLVIVFAFAFGASAAISPVLAAILGIVAYVIFFPAIIGMFYVIAASSLRGEKVGLNQAFGQAIKRILPFLGLLIVSGLITIIGFILLVIPGIYLLARLALAPVAFFEEKLGPIASLKRSFELTKGHAMEVLSALFAGQLLTFYGLLAPAASLSPIVGRYRGLKDLKESGAPKPAVHWLNYVLPFLMVLAIGLYILLIIFSVNSEKDKTPQPLTPVPSTQYQLDNDFNTAPTQDSNFTNDPLLDTQTQ